MNNKLMNKYYVVDWKNQKMNWTTLFWRLGKNSQSSLVIRILLTFEQGILLGPFGRGSLLGKKLLCTLPERTKY